MLVCIAYMEVAGESVRKKTMYAVLVRFKVESRLKENFVDFAIVPTFMMQVQHISLNYFHFINQGDSVCFIRFLFCLFRSFRM